MLLSAVVTKVELAAIIDSFTPLRIAIDEHRGRTVTLGRSTLELVAGRGLRLRGDARIAWDVAGVPIPVTLQTWQLLVIPHIVKTERSRALAFEPVIEELDLKLVPGFLDDKIADVLSHELTQNREKLAWTFSRTLGKRFALPGSLEPAEAFELTVEDGSVTVTEEELRLAVTFSARVENRAQAIPSDKPSRVDLSDEEPSRDALSDDESSRDDLSHDEPSSHDESSRDDLSHDEPSSHDESSRDDLSDEEPSRDS